ncbi:hypothetical protein EVJ50_12680 [Synechococcus sp. RSCCF101]|uniref:ribbon-helix-helix domain-containing protein n=1 Tax=Synechococcus sp. RSCCF101 TaxID=2511069 RepID=UPI001245B344|nr:hypothetical protein [Synechococcus sp. RSCCF101]QEY32953.1 hypothetical protein EVJ50_12680 [Synechococcus sp. RSCCF101]
MPTRQTSSSGRPKSPRIQVVLPEALCRGLAELAAAESRTVSNMAMVLIKQGLEQRRDPESVRSTLERQPTGRLRGAPRRLRLQRPRP